MTVCDCNFHGQSIQRFNEKVITECLQGVNTFICSALTKHHYVITELLRER